MEWLADPTAWLGLLTLIFLELVLGIDNLVFIAILADKLPPAQRDRARVPGIADAPGPAGEHRLDGDPDPAAVRGSGQELLWAGPDHAVRRHIPAVQGHHGAA